MNPEHKEFKFLGRVETVFSVATRGTVIIPIWLSSDLKVRNGDPIQLRAPDGQIKNTRITSVEFVKRERESCQYAFMLPKDVAKSEVAEGAEIWLAVENTVPSTTNVP